MAFWRRKARKKSTPQGASPTPNIDTAVPRKLFPPEVKLQAIKALEAGLTAGEVSEINRFRRSKTCIRGSPCSGRRTGPACCTRRIVRPRPR